MIHYRIIARVNGTDWHVNLRLSNRQEVVTFATDLIQTTFTFISPEEWNIWTVDVDGANDELVYHKGD